MVTWERRFNCNRVGKLQHHLTVGTLWGKPVFRRKLWRKDNIQQSLPTIGLFNRDRIKRRGRVIEGGEGLLDCCLKPSYWLNLGNNSISRNQCILLLPCVH